MGLYWKSIIVKVTGCDYATAGEIEKLIDTLCPGCSEIQLIREAPIAFRALRKLDEMSMDRFKKPYDRLTADEFCDFYHMSQEQMPRNLVKFAA
ncbi:hypothetical protein EH223_15400 [candidate division KSB1 bacterium]|nr:hypothetical protein [candidate division KSB1 bacterium]RQW01301.1 MAG: hypothetical protein EH223_15400 [candidate division KSB1 bacterium]